MIINNNKELNELKKISIGEVDINGEFVYRCYCISRSKVMSLYTEAYSEGELLLDAQLTDFKMKVYCILIDKVVGDEVVDSREFLTGIAHYSTIAALNILKRCKPKNMDEIEDLLDENNIPYLKGFNEMTRTYVRKKIKFSTNKYKLTTKKSFKVKFRTSNEMFNTMMKIAATQNK